MKESGVVSKITGATRGAVEKSFETPLRSPPSQDSNNKTAENEEKTYRSCSEIHRILSCIEGSEVRCVCVYFCTGSVDFCDLFYIHCHYLTQQHVNQRYSELSLKKSKKSNNAKKISAKEKISSSKQQRWF